MGSQSDTYEMLTAAKCGHELNVMIGRASDLDKDQGSESLERPSLGVFFWTDYYGVGPLDRESVTRLWRLQTAQHRD